MFYLDTETTGLNPHKDKITLIQSCDSVKLTDQLAVSQVDLAQLRPSDPDDHTKLIRQTNRAMSSSDDVVVGHNLAFDFAMLDYIPDSTKLFDDTWLLARLAWPHMDRHTLDDVVLEATGTNPYTPYDKKKMQKLAWGDLEKLTHEQRMYASLDVRVLHDIYKHPDIQAMRKHPVYLFDKKSVLACLKMQRRGLPIDRKAASTQAAKLSARVRDIGLPVNANSPKQVRELLKIDSTGDAVLAELIADGNQLAADVREVRRALKRVNFLNKMAAGPRYYGTIKPSARSGRTTSDHENLQNIPRDAKKFVAVSGANVLVSGDFAQLELRTIACVARDETMLDLFKAGKDLHDHTAETLFGAAFTAEQRQIAKTFNFSLLYGAGAATVRTMLLQQTGISLSVEEVQERKLQWKRTYKGIARWQRRGSERHDRGLPWQTPGGRPYTSARFTDHLSIENQGAGAEVARIALHQIDENLPDKMRPGLINFVHDSYLVECLNSPGAYKKACQVMHAAMKHGWARSPLRPVERFGLEMPVDVGVALNWKDADALKNCLYIYGDEDAKS